MVPSLRAMKGHGYKMKEREYGLDNLRIFAAIGVIYIHVVTVFINSVMATGDMLGLSVLVFFRNLFSFAVPAFILLSGAFVFAADSTKDRKSFYKKTFRRLVIPTIVFSLIFLLERVVIGVTTAGVPITVGLVWNELSHLIPDTLRGEAMSHLWYMFVLIALYLMAPFIIRIKDFYGEKGFKKVSIVLLIWGIVGNLIYVSVNSDNANFGIRAYWTLDNVINYLGLFMFGYTLHEWAKGIKEKAGRAAKVVGFIAIAVALAFIKFILTINVQITIVQDFSALNPFFVVAACSLVVASTLIRGRIHFNRLASATYWVYLVHPLVFFFYERIVTAINGITRSEYVSQIQNLWSNMGLELLISTIVSFVIGVLIEMILGRKKNK